MNYLIVGNGRLAKHLSHYLSTLNIPFNVWTRTNSKPIETHLNAHTRVLLAIPDDALEGFLALHPSVRRDSTVHFSGVRNVIGITSAHPLMTFGDQLYSAEFYQQIPFILNQGGKTLPQTLPGLPNPFYFIDADKKSLYHALCVLSGNFTTLLWENVAQLMHQELGLPTKVLSPYLEKTSENLKTLFVQTAADRGLTVAKSVLTGPLKRKDMATIVRNIDSLNARPEQNLYYAFLNYYFATQGHVAGDSYERLTI